ncbi:FAD-dependent oxidoreductase [Streptococcus sp. zg-JUN1979]|uniref:FAD-dependent oxidoreductase n=1 Tax=Streptococcus sp. zg-JUN1979 TaxID=3391450 RepID=UPI0039A5F198
MKIVIIGASFAGLSAALEASRSYPNAEILVLDKAREVAYFPNSLNWKLLGVIEDFEEARIALYRELLAINAVTWQLGSELVALYPDKKKIKYKQENHEGFISYDKLILAMGAKQSWHQEDSQLKEHFLASKTVSEAKESYAKLQQAQSVLVVGGGHIGLESLEALTTLGIRIELIEAQDGLLSKYFDKEMLLPIEQLLEEKGVRLHFGAIAEQMIVTKDGGICVETMSATYKADYLLLATNFRPHTEVFYGLLDLNADGTLWVDNYLETSCQDVFAIGDVVQMPFAFFGRSYLPLINHALLTGRLAAHNIVQKRFPLKEVERIVSSHVFGYHLISVGLTQLQASLWTDVETVVIEEQFDQWRKEQLHFKLIIEKKTHRLLGAQLVSQVLHDNHMDAIALAIAKEMTAYDCLNQSFHSAPRQTPLEPLLSRACWQYANRREVSDAY